MLYVLCILLFIGWFRTAYEALRIKKGRLTYAAYWVVLCWLLPPYFLYRPKKLMKELFDETDKIFKLEENNVLTSHKTLIAVWWFFWVCSISFSILHFISIHYYNAFDRSLTTVVTGIGASSSMVISGFLAVKVIKKYSALGLQVNIEEKSKDLPPEDPTAVPGAASRP